MDAIIVGGGIAGLQAAIQLGRYKHRIAVIDSGIGRSRQCRKYSNLLGYPEGVSGEELRAAGRGQAERLGVQFINDKVIAAEKHGQRFTVRLQAREASLSGSVMLLATGVMDRFAPIEGLEQCLGLSMFICPDCDGYEALDRLTVIVGSGNSGAKMALAIAYWTNRIIYVNHEARQIDQALVEKLTSRSIRIIHQPAATIESDDRGMLRAVRLRTGERIEAERGFIAFGGNTVRTELAEQLGAERMENGHVVTDPRSKMTSVDGLWAAGDIGLHSEMVTVAMADGTLSAVWMHKALMHGRGGLHS